ncbi:MAG: tyrosine-type recombinase/integrase [Verrucomicrobia bacterium]|nr:tyrosine-type recombinase/integrase [Verrucomicrobiota bacterium]
MKRNRFPKVIKRGSSTVKIYRDDKPQGTYFRVVYQLGGKRQRLNFKTLDAAISEAEAKAAQLSRGDVDAAQLTGRDRLVYGRACDAVKPFGVPLDAVAIEYKQARDVLKGVSLMDAARFYARHHGVGIERKPISAAVDEMIAAKKRKGVSELYLADLRYRLGKFADAFHCDVNSLTKSDVARFLDALKLSPRSHNNFLRALRAFFTYAKRHDCLSKEIDLLERVEKRTEKKAPVEIFTPKQLAALVRHSPAQLQPCIALAAFAGVRAEEILRLEWRDVERLPGFVEVAAHKAKTASRRTVPISDNLAKWLAVAPRNGERIWPHSKAWFFEALREAADAAKVQWAHNAPRHSYISYRLAEVRDKNFVAMECGTSPKMIDEHYRELTTPEQAKSWFSIAPQAAENVVPITARA